MSATDWSPFPISDFAARSRNPLRAYVETMRPPQDDPRPLIPLSLGDPTVYGNFQCPPQFDEAIVAALACVRLRARSMRFSRDASASRPIEPNYPTPTGFLPQVAPPQWLHPQHG
jgi:tyrosine aminotransferase